MAPKMVRPAVTPPDTSMPVELPAHNLIEIQDRCRRLVVRKEKVPATQAYYATISYPDEAEEQCVALCKRPLEAHATFNVLTSLSHKNIAKPIGVWEETGAKIAYIVFPMIDGAVISIEKKSIFEMEDGPEIDQSVSCFSDKGCKIFTDIVMAIKYVNGHYEQHQGQLPLKPLNLDKSSIFYQLKGDQEYQILLADFMAENPTNYARGRQKRRGNKSGFSLEDTQQLNWSGLKKYLEVLCGVFKEPSELSNLIEVLEAKPVNYDDLFWAPGLWDFGTKVQLLREVYWCYDKNEPRIATLKTKDSLGLQKCVDELGVNDSRPSDKQIRDTNLYQSLFFLRVYLVAHQDLTIKGYKEQKEDKKDVIDVNDKRCIGRFLVKEKPDYLVKLVKEIRALGWIKESPFLRRDNNYMREFY